MHRSTPANTLSRSYDSGGARTTISEVDDKTLMQEMSGNFMKGESRKNVESPQNYGFTSVVRDATKGSDGQMDASAEGFVSFLGGNRSIPICTIMDDRRYRLKELEKGDVAMFDYLQHQIHLNDKGVFVTGRTDKKMKFQLNDPPQDDSSGGGSGGSSSGGGGQKKGQTKRYDKDSKQYLEMTKDTHNLVHDQNINYKSGTHQFQPPSSSGGAALADADTRADVDARAGSDMLVQIFGNKFTGGLGYFMKQVTAAPPTSPMHLTTKGYVDSIITGLGFTIPSIPSLPIPPLPPGITLPPGVTLPFAASVEYERPTQPTRFMLDGGTF